MVTITLVGPPAERKVMADLLTQCVQGSRYTVQRFALTPHDTIPESAASSEVRVIEVLP